MSSEEKYPDLSKKILSLEKSLSNVPKLVHSWRFLAGVVFALNEYHRVANDCPPRETKDEEAYIEETRTILPRVLERPYPSDDWLRGFYYNAALMRLDACYERLFKAYLVDKLHDSEKCLECKKKIDGPYLYRKIREDFKSLFPVEEFEKSNFGVIRQEVNDLKHFPGGAERFRREQPRRLESALDELMTFIRNRKVINKLKKNFPGKGVIDGRKSKT